MVNAIVHKVWDVKGHMQIYLYEDKIEIISPEGLPVGISEDNYLNRDISILRNLIIAGAFYRLNIIEQFGAGIIRIVSERSDSIPRPNFDKCTLITTYNTNITKILE